MMNLPYELSSTIIGHIDPQYWSSISQSSRRLNCLFQDPHFWRKQCHKWKYSGHNQVAFRHSWCTARNWNLGRYHPQDLPTQGHVCYILDGASGRAVGAPVGPDSVACLWDLRTGQWMIHGARGVCAAALDGNMLVYGLRDGQILQRDIRENRSSERLLGTHLGEVAAVALVNGNLATGSYNGFCKVWDLRTAQPLQEKLLDSSITAVTISRNGQNYACATVLGAIHLSSHRVENVEMVHTDGGAINCLEYHDTRLYAGSDDGNVRIINDTGHLEKMLTSGLTSPTVSICKTRERILTGHSNGLITYRDWKGETGSSTEPLYMVEKRGIVWKLWADNEYALSSSLDERLLIHDFRPHSHNVYC